MNYQEEIKVEEDDGIITRYIIMSCDSGLGFVLQNDSKILFYSCTISECRIFLIGYIAGKEDKIKKE